MNTELVRIVDAISRDKNIERESVFADLEAAMVSAARKAFDDAEEIAVSINRINGEILAKVDGKPIDMKTLGRIAAQTAKQVMIQKIREDERDSLFAEYSQRVGTVVSGVVSRIEGGALIVNLGRGEGFMPRSEQIPGQTHQAGERVRAMILDVREEVRRVRILLTQTHPDYIRKLFELEVPEVSERIIQVRALAREAGYRTKIAVSSIDSKVDAVGACVGVRGSRIRNIVDELGGEKVDIVRWNESSQVLITNALKPAEVKETFLCFELGRATVLVDEDQLSLAIGKRGQNVRLGARLTGWDIDIQTPAEYDKNIDAIEKALKTIDGVEDVLLDKMLAMGIVSLADFQEVGAEPLTKELGLDESLANRIVEVAGVAAKRFAEEAEAAKVAAAEAAKVAAAETAAAEAAKAADETPGGGAAEVADETSGGGAAEVTDETPGGEATKVADGNPGKAGEAQSAGESGSDSDGVAGQTEEPTPQSDDDVSAAETAGQ